MSANNYSISNNIMSTMKGAAAAAFVASNVVSLCETALNAQNIYEGNSESISYEGAGLKTVIVGFYTLDGFVNGVSSHGTGKQDCLEFTVRGALPEFIEGIHSVIGLPGAALAGTAIGVQHGVTKAYSIDKPAGLCGGPA